MDNANKRQQGFVLFITLMIMLLMSITALALLRSVDSGTLVANNVGYKEASLIAADKGVKAAADLLNGGTIALTGNSPTNGFYATPQSAIDWTGQATPADSSDDVDWGQASGSLAIKASAWSARDSAGNKYSYVIHRLCDGIGPTSGVSCATSASATAAVGSTHSGSSYGSAPLSVTSQIYYRITVKVVGPKNTTSYAQAYVLI